MKIVHLSDIHYCDKFLEEVDRCMEAATVYVSAIEPGLVVISGDLFDHRLEQNSPALLTAIGRVRELADYAPVLVLQGTYSHDAPHAIDVFRHISSPGAWPIYVADRTAHVLLDHGCFYDEDSGEAQDVLDAAQAGHDPFSNPLLISCLPPVHKGQVAAQAGSEGAGEAAGHQIAVLLQSWATKHREMRALGIPSIVVSHGTVSGCTSEHGVPMVGFDHEFTTGALFAAGAEAVLLGHIHKHQSWGVSDSSQAIAYAGSLGRLHFGEVDPKGFIVWDVAPCSARGEFIETPAKVLLEIEYPGPPDMANLAELAARATARTHVRVRYKVDEEHRTSVDKGAIAKLFAHCAECKIEGTILPVQRQRAAGIGRAPSVSDKLIHWASLTDSVHAPLLARLAALQGQDVDKLTEEFAS